MLLKHLVIFVLLAFSGLAVTSCASMNDGPSQEITIEAPGSVDTLCTLDNGSIKYRVNPPQTVRITTNKNPMIVHCVSSGNREKTVVVNPVRSDFAEADLYSLGVGTAYDHFSGALYRYPNPVFIDFSKMKLKEYPLPGYQYMLGKNEALARAEEYRPGLPALQSDAYEQKIPFRRREQLDAEDTSGAALGEESYDMQPRSSLPPTTLDPSGKNNVVVFSEKNLGSVTSSTEGQVGDIYEKTQGSGLDIQSIDRYNK